VVQIGGHGVHVPYSITWEHETVAPAHGSADYHMISSIAELVPLLAELD
jgi:putative hydrolase of the HAD superfamily